ncbi:MAG: oligosaccharide flippase family protein [Bacteroidota bacterium]
MNDKTGDYSKAIYQTATLFFFQLLVVLLGFFAKGFQTRALGPELYGLIALFGTITGFTVLFFRFGFFASLRTILANNKDQIKEREFFGTGFIITLCIGAFYTLFVFIISFWIDGIFNIEFGHVLRLFAPLCFILPFNFLIPALSVGSNKVHFISIFEVISIFLFVIPLAVFFLFDGLYVELIIGLKLLAIIVTTAGLYFAYKPLFSNLKERLKEVWQKNREFGFRYYSGAILNQTTFKLDEVFITYFINISQLGFYTLANVICSPMVMMSRAFSNALFKKFTDQNKIPLKVFFYNCLWLVACIVFLFFCSRLIIELMFGKEYLEVAVYIIPLSFAYLLQGLYQPFTFLAAKSKGKEIRNVAIIEAVFNVIGNLILVPMYGVMGAIWASIIAKGIDFFGMLYYYMKYLKHQ